MHGNNSTGEEAKASEVKLAVYNFEKRLDIFHVGIFVHGKEFHYGVRQGILVCNPKNDGKVFRVIVYDLLPRQMAFLKYVDLVSAGGAKLMSTFFSFDQLLRVKASLESARFGPDTYRLFRNNCLDFATAFLRLILQNDHELSKKMLPREIRQPWATWPIRAVDRKINQKRKKHVLHLAIH